MIVWHDEIIDATKCRDTSPVSEGDEMYPYVGKNVANLTLAQIKTLDCGSLRIDAFPLSGKSWYMVTFTRGLAPSLLSMGKVEGRGGRRKEIVKERRD